MAEAAIESGNTGTGDAGSDSGSDLVEHVPVNKDVPGLETPKPTPVAVEADATPAEEESAPELGEDLIGELEEETPKDKPTQEAEDGSSDGEEVGHTAPAKYSEFTMPEGFSVSDDELGGFQSMVRDLNGGDGISQKDAQSVVQYAAEWMGRMAGIQGEANASALTDLQKGWASEIRNDPKLGGANLKTSNRIVLSALQNKVGRDFLKLMSDTGMKQHPTVFKLLHQHGLAIAGDSHSGGEGEGDDPKAREAFRDFYPELKAKG